MTIHYAVSTDDYLQFNLFHYRQNKTMQRQVRSTRVFLGIALLLLLIYLLVGGPRIHVVILLLLGLVFLLFYPRFFQRTLVRMLRRQIRAGQYKEFIGDYTLTAGSDGLHEQAPGKCSIWQWQTVQSVEQDSERLYIYIGASTALIIPFAAFDSDTERAQFVDFVQQGVAGARGSSRTQP